MLAISFLVIVEINLENLSAHNLWTFEHFDSNKTAHSLQPTAQPHSDCMHKRASVSSASTPPFPWQFGWVWCKYGVCAFLLVRKGSKCLHTTSLSFFSHLNPWQQILPDLFKNPNWGEAVLEKATSQFFSQTTVPICFSLVSTGGLRRGKKQMWCTMFIHWISYLCSTRGSIYADNQWLYLVALLHPPPGNTEWGVNKGPQQLNHETNISSTNIHSQVRNTP